MASVICANAVVVKSSVPLPKYVISININAMIIIAAAASFVIL
ncbi:unnamed protein product, partial [marine sediment metagenome]